MDNMLPGRFAHPPKITIDAAVCDREGLCVRVCADQIFIQPSAHDVPEITHPEMCSLCGHCIAACPENAITHSDLDQMNFPDRQPEHKISPEQFIPFTRLRRSIRNYHPGRKVTRQTIKTLLEAARYAPTGCNTQSLEYIVIRDPDLRNQLVSMCLDTYRSLIRNSTSTGTASDPDISPRDIHQLKILIEEADHGRDPIFYQAPVVIIIHAPDSTPTPLEDAALATYQLMLTAHSLDFGTCYIGNFYLYANHSKEICALLQIPDENRIISSLTLGYPAIRYRRMVDRTRPRVRWL